MQLSKFFDLRHGKFGFTSGQGSCLVGIQSNLPDATPIDVVLLRKKEGVFNIMILRECSVDSAEFRNTLIDFFNVYCKDSKMTHQAKYYELANYEDIATGYIEWEGQDKTDPEYFNDYYTIGIEQGVVRVGSIFYKEGRPAYQIVKRKAVFCDSVDEAHQRMSDYLGEKIVSDALGV